MRLTCWQPLDAYLEAIWEVPPHVDRWRPAFATLWDGGQCSMTVPISACGEVRGAGSKLTLAFPRAMALS